jgi:hypothetical protein
MHILSLSAMAGVSECLVGSQQTLQLSASVMARRFLPAAEINYEDSCAMQMCFTEEERNFIRGKGLGRSAQQGLALLKLVEPEEHDRLKAILNSEKPKHNINHWTMKAVHNSLLETHSCSQS